MNHTVFGKLKVQFYDEKSDMGHAMAQAVTKCILELLQKKDTINMVFAAAPSQLQFLRTLALDEKIPWQKINAFHMDEYVGLDPEDSRSFANFLNNNIFDKLPFKNAYLLNGKNSSLELECKRYAELLHENPPDIICMGIGENAHIAFNDPHVANFNDPQKVKIVDLDVACKKQQVNDGCFSTVSEVPNYAITLTIPTLMSATHIFCIVPGASKAEAVYHTLFSSISEDYPASCLRLHPDAFLFLDGESSNLVTEAMKK